MPKIKQLLRLQRRDESQGRHETDPAYLARIVRENATRHNFSALTFRFCHALGLGLPAAQLARAIAGNAGDYASLLRSSERELSAASVYMASHVCRAPKALAEIARVTGVGADAVRGVYVKLYREQEGLSDQGWRDIFGGPTSLSAGEIRRTLAFPPFAS